MQPMLNIATQAALQAGKIINQFVDRLDTINVSIKGYNNFVSDVDKLAEKEIIYTINKAYPEHDILAEESGENSNSSDYCWIIDPLDGTTNFIHGFPQFAVSIALKYKDEISLGVIYDPTTHELFTAIKGKGAHLNNKRMRTSKPKVISRSLIGTGFPVRDQKNIDSYMNVLKEVLSQTSGIRRAGAAALDLAYVACGRLDGFWEDGLKPWDIAAGMLMIRESGGIVTDYNNDNDNLTSGQVVAGGKLIHKTLLSIISKYTAEAS
jgi:myo-inositol-1(or 4)-monophosphatase